MTANAPVHFNYNQPIPQPVFKGVYAIPTMAKDNGVNHFYAVRQATTPGIYGSW